MESTAQFFDLVINGQTKLKEFFNEIETKKLLLKNSENKQLNVNEYSSDQGILLLYYTLGYNIFFNHL